MQKITIETTIHAPVDKVWQYWHDPERIMQWAFASDDWECPHAENDLRVGRKFLTRMSAKDKSESFDFIGTYTEVVPHERIAYTMEGGRTVTISFERIDDQTTKVIETFDMEDINPEEIQRAGWQAILANFKKLCEK